MADHDALIEEAEIAAKRFDRWEAFRSHATLLHSLASALRAETLARRRLGDASVQLLSARVDDGMKIGALSAERNRLREALDLVDGPYPIEVFPDLERKDEVFGAMRAVNKYATEQFYAMVARQRGEAVRAHLRVAALVESENG